MDVDDERILEIARQDDYDPVPLPSSSRKENPAPKKVKILTPQEPTSAPTKEKPARKTYVERPLATQFPDTEEKLVSQMLNEKIQLTIGEVFAISNGAVDAFKKKISPKRVPIDQPKTTNAGDVNSDDEEEEAHDSGPAHYACPLGYVAVTINGKQIQALLDNGSQVNLLPRDLAGKMGLIITQKPMKLRGIGGHKSDILGIAENVPVKVGNITKEVHFWVSSAAVQPILGKPWLIDVSASIQFKDSGVESLSIKKNGQTYLVPILNPSNQKYETTFPINSATTSSHFLASGTFQK